MKSQAIIECIEHINTHNPKASVVFCHGYGADMNDLEQLAFVLDPAGEYNWFFPNGILQVPIGPGFFGRAWFNINIAEYDEAVRSGKHRDLSSRRPKGLDEASLSLKTFLNEKALDPAQLVLGGFSQGAMLATEVALTLETAPKALVLLSGAMLDEKNWKEKMKSRRGLAFFAAHGMNDPVLSFEGAKDLAKAFVEAGWQGHLESFKGGHEIPQPVLQNLTYFLKGL
jgi:phospholipase/carboxylesterase